MTTRSIRVFVSILLLLMISPVLLYSKTSQVSLTDEERRWLADHPVIRVGVGVAFPPFMWMEHEDDVPVFKGIASDYLKLLSEKLNIEMDIVLDIPFATALDQARDGDMDFFPLLVETPERSKYLSFTDPYLSYPLVIVTRQDSPPVKKFNDLEGLRFAVVEHLAIFSRIQEYHPGLDLDFVLTKTVDENLDLVATGQADACIINLAAGGYYIHQKGLTNLKIAAPLEWETLHYSMGIRSDWPIFKRIIDKAIDSITDEEKKQISKRWITIEIDTGVDIALILKWSALIGLLVVAAFSLFFAWNRRLHKEIREREKAEEALKTSEMKLKNIIENSTNMFYSHAVDKTNTYVSPQSWEYLQCSPEEALVRWEDLATDNPINQRGIELTDKAIRTGQRQPSYELELAGKEGKVIMVEVHEAPVVENGKTVSIVGSLTNITERKRAETALREQTKTLGDILDKAADGICVCHNIAEEPFVRFTQWNPRMVELTGYQIEEINELGWYQTVYPDPFVRQKAVERMKNMRLGDDIKAEQWDITTKSGGIKTVMISSSVLKEMDGETHVLALMHDVSDRKSYEEKLISSRKEWENIFQAIGSPTMILDPQRRILQANQATLEMTGLTEQQIRGRMCCDLFHGSPHPHSSCPMNPLLADKKHSSTEIRMMDTMGTFLISCTPILDADGEVEKIIHIATDISRTKELEEQLRHAHKMEAIGTLAGGIAHDFNNVLSSIIGFTELAMDDTRKGSQLEDNLQEVYAAGKRAKDLVKQILAFARKSEEESEPVQPGVIVEEVIRFIRSSTPATIEINQNISSRSYIMASPVQIHQVVMNLLTNAAQAMEESGGQLDVSANDTRIGYRGDVQVPGLTGGEYVEIKISDSGTGIPPEIIDSIFEPYFTTKVPGEGTGMGLAVVQGIVELYHGRILVESVIGQGSTFTIYLPVTGRREKDLEYIKEELPGGTEKILLVDDEVPIAKVSSQILTRLGYEVTTCTDSIEACRIFNDAPESYDLVITDMTMPGMTGDKLAEELLRINPDLPIILCTGYSKQITEAEARRLGIMSFVYKPIVKADLAKTVRTILDEV